MSGSHEDHLGKLARQAEEAFRGHFGRPADYLVAAPGRVNLIGEHTDYNDGYVLPMAIERYTVFAADRATQPTVRLYRANLDEDAAFPIDESQVPDGPRWSSYVRGVVRCCQRRGMQPGGFDAVILSSVPLGGGLSSSAALEVAAATLIELLTGQVLDRLEKARLCQRAEHEFAAVPCGIMDQFTSVMAQPDHLVLLDCRSLQANMVPLTDPEVTVLIIDSKVKHELSQGEYARRRAECEAAARALQVGSLRDITTERLDPARSNLDPVLYRRARHVVTENERTLAAANAIRRGDWTTLESLLYASHQSLRDDYQVSCPELDLLVDVARSLGEGKGLFGSRMTGGGFGGCTVSLVRTEAVDAVADAICQAYSRQTNIRASWFATRPAGGPRVLRCP